MVGNNFKQQLSMMITGEVSSNELMSRHTTWRIGGPADYFCRPANPNDFKIALAFATEKQMSVTIIGGGSNVLVDDLGIRGLVIKTTGLKKIDFIKEKVIVQSGFSLPLLARQCMEKNLGGLEFAAGIPGTVGGAVIMNAGAHGGSMDQIVQKVTTIDGQGKVHEYNNEAMNFGYRTSKLNRKTETVIQVQLQLCQRKIEETRALMQQYKKFRTHNQPFQYPTAGSVFKNPPGYSAGRLIDEVGAKGWQIGNAQVSEKHANFILNLGGATSGHVLDLMEKVQKAVHRKHGVDLEPEIIFLGG